jgi:SAM-dependent methyltransferase
MTNRSAYTYRFEPADLCVMCGGTEAKTLGKRLNRPQGWRTRCKIGITTTVVKCRACGLVYTNPRPVPETLGQHYDRPPEEYSTCFHYGNYPEEFFQLWHGDHVPRALEIGAGIGKGMAGLQERGFDAFGVEPSRQFRDRALKNGIAPDRLQLAAVEDVQYEAGAFDFVIFNAVLEHLQDPATVLTRAVSWVAPNGFIYLAVPAAKWLLTRLVDLAYRLQGMDYVAQLSPMHPPFHLYGFTPESFARHGRRASYDVVKHQTFPWDTYLPRPADALASWIMAATGTGMEMQVWLRPAMPAS